MKRLTLFLASAALFLAACGGGDDDNGGSSVTIAPEDAQRVASEAMPTVDELPGTGWQLIAEDNFGDDSSDGDDFWTYIQDEPACATLQDLAALESVFGSEERDTSIGRAQREFENLQASGMIPSAIEVEVDIDESAATTQAGWSVVSQLFNSDDMTDCFLAMFDTAFSQEMGDSEGIEISVTEGERLASSPPQDAVSMAFDIEMTFLGIEFEMAIQMYLWAYGNARVQVMFIGDPADLTGDVVNGVLTRVDEKLQAAAAN